ncbi:MAG TPA: hypothetical protein VK427_00730 [Kofleriaceae bacterium]|nr:hypothetical protein [Kofleriaceae bacterium]
MQLDARATSLDRPGYAMPWSNLEPELVDAPMIEPRNGNIIDSNNDVIGSQARCLSFGGDSNHASAVGMRPQLDAKLHAVQDHGHDRHLDQRRPQRELDIPAVAYEALHIVTREPHGRRWQIDLETKARQRRFDLTTLSRRPRGAAAAGGKIDARSNADELDQSGRAGSRARPRGRQSRERVADGEDDASELALEPLDIVDRRCRRLVLVHVKLHTSQGADLDREPSCRVRLSLAANFVVMVAIGHERVGYRCPFAVTDDAANHKAGPHLDVCVWRCTTRLDWNEKASV